MVLIFLKVLALGSRSSTEVRWFVTKSEQVKKYFTEICLCGVTKVLTETSKRPLFKSPYQLFWPKRKKTGADKYTFLGPW